ncbi:MAG: molybdenum cofactor biosynthesis protein MoaE [Methylovirgula sp.]|uniref:molybdenum cofactor biosynthesis protein MoaE n=1 Tax=Methylovirgula sp. TaxID=1978224 RepID=UPI0030763733
MAQRIVRVVDQPFDIAAETATLELGAGTGALVTFTGLCRDEGGMLATLEIEAYPEMAEAEIARVVDEAEQRWPLDAIAVIHRYGHIRPGEAIVFVATASAHRTEAFHAAEFLMDYLKTRAPFWKKTHRSGGSGDWVAAKDDDEAAAARW